MGLDDQAARDSGSAQLLLAEFQREQGRAPETNEPVFHDVENRRVLTGDGQWRGTGGEAVSTNPEYLFVPGATAGVRAFATTRAVGGTTGQALRAGAGSAAGELASEVTIVNPGSVVAGLRRIPGIAGRVTGGNSTTLGRNMMEDMGQPRSTKWPGYQAQHLIPIEAGSHPVIQKIGMDLDDASNGFFLPTTAGNLSPLSRHTGYHSVYSQVVLRKLDQLDATLPVDELLDEVYSLQQRLLSLQKQGLPLYPSQGATVDLWMRWLDKADSP